MATKRMFGTSEDFDTLVRAHSGAGNSSVYVVLHSTKGETDPYQDAEICETAFQISQDLWICRLSDELRKAVYDACESPGTPNINASRLYGQLYTLALFAGPWAPGQVTGQRDAEINTLVGLSQLVHQTTLGFANSAKLDFDPKGHLLQATPHACRGVTEQAFMVTDQRNWLSKAEIEKVRELYSVGLTGLSDNVKRANWYLQHAYFQYFFEVRSLLMVAGLEALVRADKSPNPVQRMRSTQQFVDGSTRLARLLGQSFTKNDAERVFQHRSDVAHGRNPWASRLDLNDRQEQVIISESNDIVQRYLKAERLLRQGIICAILDSHFSEKLSSS